MDDGSEKPVSPQAIPPVDVFVSTTDFTDETGLEIWPNPTDGELHLTWKPTGEPVEIGVIRVESGDAVLAQQCGEVRVGNRVAS